jgi:hypothetical protein
MPVQIAQSVDALAKPIHFSLILKPEQEGGDPANWAET